MKLRCRDRVLDLSRTAVMGVLNVTPDSFSDGGLWFDRDVAIEHGREMVAGGASVVDVGGESTRPGAAPVSEEEEARRVLPVIEALASELDVPVSIDTRKPVIARAAVEAGASIVNDTTGEDFDRAMQDICRDSGAALLVMHSRGTPETMRSLNDYDDVVTHVAGFLRRRAEELIAAGLHVESIALDPGFGFAKSPQQNLVLLHRLDEIIDLGFPVIAGTSRKSFIGEVLGLPEDQRLEGTAATVAWAVFKGAHMVRVHDVVSMTRVVRMSEAIREMRLPWRT